MPVLTVPNLLAISVGDPIHFQKEEWVEEKCLSAYSLQPIHNFTDYEWAGKCRWVCFSSFSWNFGGSLSESDWQYMMDCLFQGFSTGALEPWGWFAVRQVAEVTVLPF